MKMKQGDEVTASEGKRGENADIKQRVNKVDMKKIKKEEKIHINTSEWRCEGEQNILKRRKGERRGANEKGKGEASVESPSAT